MQTSLSATAVVLAVVLSACGSAAEEGAAKTDGRLCSDAAEEVGDLVVRVADHVATSESGSASAAVEAPVGVGAWDLLGWLADGSGDLEDRVATARRDIEQRSCPADVIQETVERRVEEELSDRAEDLRGEQLDRDAYAAVTFMSLMAARFRSAPAGHDVPEGFPAEFPVYPGAVVVDSDIGEDASVNGTWQLAEDYEAVADYYLDALQEGRRGGWDVAGGEASGTVGANGQAASGRQVLHITGYGYTGTVEISSPEAGQVVVTAGLVPQG